MARSIEMQGMSMMGRLALSPRIRGCAVTIVAAGCAALLTAGCAPSAKPAATSAASRTAAAASASASASATKSAHPTVLVADAAVRRELRAAFIADRRTAARTPGFAPIPPSAVAAVSPRTVFYAFDQATGIYWATASFSPTAAAAQTAAAIGFQDGGNEAVFERSEGTAWRVESVGQCLKGLPLAIATATRQVGGPNPMCRSGIPPH